MRDEEVKKLLQNKKVIDEINRHRWIESEKAGRDIGFETASADWIERFSKAWMDYHMPKRKLPLQNFPINKAPAKKEAETAGNE